ncbi:MAG: FAD-binding oxidoreductase, partial [Lentisphaerae bacterium]
QKASAGTIPALAVLRAIPGLTVHYIDSGCCGVAGTFGYEKEHYEFSVRIGELALLPAVREIPHDHHVVASGLSCRSQIQHGTRRQALHFIELIDSLIR